LKYASAEGLDFEGEDGLAAWGTYYVEPGERKWVMEKLSLKKSTQVSTASDKR